VTDRSDSTMKYIFIVPVLAYILVIAIFPLLFSLFLSLSRWTPGARGLEFIGLDNFRALAGDSRFWEAFRRTLGYVLALIVFQWILGTFIAALLQKNIKGKSIFRVCYMFPMLLSPIAVAYAFKMIFDFSRGPANHFLRLFGVAPVEWLSGSTPAFITLVIVDVWQWTPFMILTILAAFENIPQQMYEAAVVDGAKPFRIFWRITLPLALPIVMTVTLLRTIDAFKVFDTIYILTGGGPGRSTELVNFYIYLVGFRAFNLGYGAAMSWVQLFLIIIIFTYYIRSLKRIGGLR